ncbi:hypothetical protein D3C73_1510290 [compost metagenome]
MRDVRQHAAHGFLQLGKLHRSLMIDVQQPVQIGKQNLQMRIIVEQKQPFVRPPAQNIRKLGMDIVELAGMLPQTQVLP